MTNEEAIKYLNECSEAIGDTEHHTLSYAKEALNMAIKALSQQTDDAVSRTEFIVALMDSGIDHLQADNLIEIGQIVFGLPPVTPKQRTGHNCNEDYADCDQFVCSECGIELQDWHRIERDEDDGEITCHEYVMKYCPNCGTKVGMS